MPRNPYKKISTKLTKQQLYNHVKYLQKKLQAYESTRNRFGKIGSILKTHKSTKTTDFINKYHKTPSVWSNKLAYLAGLIDGEGHLKIEKWGTIRLIIGMTDRNTIYWIYNNFGGNVKFQLTQSGKKFYVWRMNQGKDLFYLFLLVIPFLVTKKKILTKAMKNLIDKFSKLQHSLDHTRRALV